MIDVSSLRLAFSVERGHWHVCVTGVWLYHLHPDLSIIFLRLFTTLQCKDAGARLAEVESELFAERSKCEDLLAQKNAAVRKAESLAHDLSKKRVFSSVSQEKVFLRTVLLLSLTPCTPVTSIRLAA